MDEFPGLSACRAWVLRERLPDHWARIDPDQRDRALAFWIRASETDEWTFEQLRDLVGAAMDVGETTPALDQWAREVTARRRRKPTRTGPKSNPQSDYRLMAAVEIRRLVFGETDHAARRAVAEELNAKNPQYNKVRKAHERANRWPPGVWPNSE